MINPTDQRRLRDGARAMGLKGPVDLLEIKEHIEIVRDGIRALQSTDDLGSTDANAKAWSDMLELQRRLKKLEKERDKLIKKSPEERLARLINRIYNWKFSQAEQYLKGAPAKTAAAILSLSKRYGNHGWPISPCDVCSGKCPGLKLRVTVEKILRELGASTETIKEMRRWIS